MLNRIIVKKFKRLKILISIAWLDLFCQAYSQASDKWWAEKSLKPETILCDLSETCLKPSWRNFSLTY